MTLTEAKKPNLTPPFPQPQPSNLLTVLASLNPIEDDWPDCDAGLLPLEDDILFPLQET